MWVDGQEVATHRTVQGDYTRYTFDITSQLRRGLNTLALEVYPNNPNTMFTLDNVDWTQIPPDNNTGIQFPVQLAVDGALSDGNAHVVDRGEHRAGRIPTAGRRPGSAQTTLSRRGLGT